MKKCLAFVLAMSVLPAMCVASVQGKVVEKPLVGQTLDSFNLESARIREQMKPGGVYEHIRPADKARVEARMGEMEKLLSAHSTQADLRPEDKVALLNEQEEVNGILRHNDNNRLICEHVAPVGSHIPVTTCRTFGDLMVQQQQDQKYMTDRQAVPQQKGGN